MPFKFYIQDLYDRTEVEEPRGWKDITSVLERDFDVHGVFFKYTDGTVKLGFSCDSKTLLEAAYQQDGSEAFYLFEVDEAENDFDIFTTIFSGLLDFSTRNFDEDYFDIDVNEINEIDKIKNRSNLKINLNKGLSLDGIDLSNINYDDSIYSLATKNFKQLIVKNEGETLEAVQSTAATSASFLYANFGFPIVESDELEKYRQRSTAMNTSVITGDLLTLEKAGALDMNFDYNFDLNLTEDQGSSTTNYFATLSIKFDPPIGGVLDEIALDTENAGAASPFNTTLTFLNDVDQTIFAEAGTKIWLELEIQQTSTGTTQMTCELDITKFDVTITDKIGIPGTQAQWYHLHDALNKNLNIITGEYDYLFSDLLGDLERGYSINGCLSGMRKTNGFRVRQINDTDKAPIFSFKDFLSNTNTIVSVGYGIEQIISPIELGIQTIEAQNISIYDLFTVLITGDFSSSLRVGDFMGFFDSETLYGTWEITFSEFDDEFGTTEIKLNVAGHSALFRAQNITGNAFITTSKNATFRDRLRVEKWEHFYGDNELIDLGVVQEYSEEPFDDILYNELNIKFSKFSNDEEKSTTLEEIHTESGWGLPLTKSDKRLSLVLQWIGSTHLFNESRERIFSRKPTTSHILDNNIFFCDKSEKTGVYTVDFSAGTDRITMPADAFENVLNGSDFFSISDAVDVANNGTHQVDTTQQVIFDITNNEYSVPVFSSLDGETNDEVTITHVEDTQKLFKPEANDKLSSSSGITRPTYIMNQRRTMKRFLISWGRYVSSVLAYLVDSANVTIQNLFFINNGDFSSEIDTSEFTSDCLMGDNSGALIQEADNVNTLALGTAKFKPNIIKGTVRICDEDFDKIKGAHKNKYKVGVFDGVTYLESQLAKANTNFIHQTGIFDITVKCSFINWDDTVNSSIPLYDYISGDGFQIYYSNSNESAPNELGIDMRSNGVANYAYTNDIGSLLHDEKLHTIRFKGIGNDIILTIDGVEFFVNKPTFNYSGALDSTFILTVGGGAIGSDSHIGNIESIKIINNINEEIINYNFSNGNDSSIQNTGIDAPVSSDLVWVGTAAYEIFGYGYLIVTSPNDKTVTGWLMKIKRNPVDRIAKVELLERFTLSVYNFSGAEQISFTSIDQNERTDTFIYKARIKNGTTANLFPLWTNATDASPQTGTEIAVYNSGQSIAFANKVLIQLINTESGPENKIRVLSDTVLSQNFLDIEVTYDGSSTAAGITLKINGVSKALNIVDDSLSDTIIDNSVYKVGRRIDETTSSVECEIESFEWTLNDILVFKTDCRNNGNVCIDLSNNGNNGLIELNGTTEKEFFIFE